MFDKEIGDREKLIELLHKSADILINTPVEGYAERLADYPIANVVVIQKQAEWVKETETYGRTFYRCSRCNTTSQYGRTKQCRYCGSKMKEVK